jgi:hypothetical protein
MSKYFELMNENFLRIRTMSPSQNMPVANFIGPNFVGHKVYSTRVVLQLASMILM